MKESALHFTVSFATLMLSDYGRFRLLRPLHPHKFHIQGVPPSVN
jgi:hypothetical protein